MSTAGLATRIAPGDVPKPAPANGQSTGPTIAASEAVSGRRRSSVAAPGSVLIVCPGGLEHGGGIGRQMGYFMAARPARGNGPVYRVLDPRGPWFLGSSPWHTVLAVFYLAAAAGTLVRARFRGGPALAHVNITGRGSTIRKIVLTAVARACGLPYLLHVHDYDYAAEYNRRGPMMRYLIRNMFGGARQILVLGGTAREALFAALRLRPDQISVLHNAVPDPLAGRPPALLAGSEPAGQAQSCGLLFLGHLSARKGVPELLRALATPVLQDLAWHATIAGGGPVADYRRLAADLGIGDKVAFPGWVDQQAASGLCRQSAILVLPSHAEGLAMSVLEGLSHGMALVVTPVGSHPEVIDDGISGLFVASGDVDGLADALARVIKDSVLRQALQEGARQRFLQGFEIGDYARRLAELHQALLSAS